MTIQENTSRTNPWLVLAVMCLGLFMTLIDTTIVNIAIPSIIEGLDASLDEILWIINAYVLVLAVLLITAGRLGDIFGPKRLFLAGLTLFTLASALCGLAQDPTHLIIARALQGVGGALLSPQMLAVITSLFPPGQRGAAFAIPGAVAGVAVAAGPPLGACSLPTSGGLRSSTSMCRWVSWLSCSPCCSSQISGRVVGTGSTCSA